MKILKLDPMTFLMLVVVLGVALTMSTQANDGPGAKSSGVQISQATVAQTKKVEDVVRR